MRRIGIVLLITIVAAATLAAQAPPAQSEAAGGIDLSATIAALEEELVARHGDAIRPRLARGLRQAASFWRAADGDAETFEQFVRANFAADEPTREAMFERLQLAFEQLGGLMLEAVRELRMHADLDRGPILPFDQILAGYDPSAHLNDDLFANKLAFIVLLNFPLTTLEERMEHGEQWSRREWAEVRLAQGFGRRVPASVNLAIAGASAAADSYVAEYNIWMHHLLDRRGNRLFPEKLRLLSHWNLRDELKANYAEPKGLAKQQMIQRVMERIVGQTIPEIVVDNPRVDWNPYTNEVKASPVVDYDPALVEPLPETITNAPEPATRYARLLEVFRAHALADPYSPTAPTLIARRFDENREIPEERVRAIFERVLASPMVPRVARLIEKRLGRRLEPFDIWYNGFRPRGAYTEAQLDAITRERYPTAEAFGDDVPNILRKLGFDPETADYVASMIEVHPARGSGHAFGAGRRGDKAYLRTRVGANGMDYKGYNIAVHELGHNVEQVLSINRIDYTLLQGVPNTAFTEALAFVFQGRDLELLGLAKPDAESRALAALDEFWGTYEIAGVALVDMGVWHWMYDNPDATPTRLRDATVAIAKDVWNRYYAPVFGTRDVVLLGIYSHMIGSTLYLPDYPLGHLIAFQIEQQVEKSGLVGPEFTRMSVIGNLLPDLWMERATGAPVGPQSLLEATEAALGVIR
ncbi:MAG TPA: hypothetical protein VMS56_11475 [Thermoanaerobaculia bacterium]|nr:hypothetical protein [Thermoanaerobaculia bacterium]